MWKRKKPIKPHTPVWVTWLPPDRWNMGYASMCMVVENDTCARNYCTIAKCDTYLYTVLDLTPGTEFYGREFGGVCGKDVKIFRPKRKE